jgi:hypothetical protein
VLWEHETVGSNPTTPTTSTASFLVLWATGPIARSAHLIGGTVVLAGGVGWALSLLFRAGLPTPGG